MSLIRSTEMSTTSYGNPRLFSLQGGNNSSGLSAQLCGSDKKKMIYLNESFSGPSYEPKFLMDSPSEEIFHLSRATPEAVVYDEGKMRLKLRELEHALLDDEDTVETEVVTGPGPRMELDEEWASPLRNPMLQDSPKESSSTESSNCSGISSNKEVSIPSRCTPEQMLFNCATMIWEGNFEEAATTISELRKMVSIQGDPSQRIAAYVVEGLAARLASSAIMEAIKNEKMVHVIDFDINQGNQYMNLIQTLAKQGGKQTKLRLTGVDDPESVQRPIGGLRNIGQRLEALAELVGLPFEFKAIPTRTPLVRPELLECRTGEALVVNFAFQLHHMPDESVSTINQRDRLLRMVKSLNPKIVTMVEQDVNTNTTPFLSRFAEAYSYYSAVFESLDATLPRESQDRVNVEKQCLARDIVNIIACEGEERIERYEVAGKWRARMLMAGFTPLLMNKNISDMIQQLIVTQYCNRYKLKEEMGTLYFGWEDKNLVVASAWT